MVKQANLEKAEFQRRVQIPLEPAGGCAACGGMGRVPLVSVEGWEVMRCLGCGLGILDPRPSLRALHALYDEAYFNIRQPPPMESVAVNKAVRNSGRLLRSFRSYKSAGRLLDIGCGAGYFLAAAQRAGFEVRGVEPSAWGIAVARDMLRLPVDQTSIETVDFAAGSFDFINMSHVLEHVSSPPGLLGKVKGWLAPGGIAVIRLPNCASYDARRYGPQWYGWQVPYHLWHFTPAALARLLTASGFSVMECRLDASRYIKEEWMNVPVVSWFRHLIAQFYSGRDMTIIATPDRSDNQTQSCA